MSFVLVCWQIEIPIWISWVGRSTTSVKSQIPLRQWHRPRSIDRNAGIPGSDKKCRLWFCGEGSILSPFQIREMPPFHSRIPSIGLRVGAQSKASPEPPLDSQTNVQRPQSFVTRTYASHFLNLELCISFWLSQTAIKSICDLAIDWLIEIFSHRAIESCDHWDMYIIRVMT